MHRRILCLPVGWLTVRDLGAETEVSCKTSSQFGNPVAAGLGHLQVREPSPVGGANTVREICGMLGPVTAAVESVVIIIILVIVVVVTVVVFVVVEDPFVYRTETIAVVIVPLESFAEL